MRGNMGMKLLKSIFTELTKPRLSYIDFIIIGILANIVIPMITEIIQGLFLP